MTRTTDLEKQIRKASAAYYNDVPIMSDAEFDALVDELRALSPKSKVLTEIGAPIVGKKVALPFPMLSLDKLKPDDVDSWVNKQTGPFIVSDKLDGTSAMLHYVRHGNSWRAALFRRGTGTIGADISHLIKHLANAATGPNGLTHNAFAVRGEIIMTKAKFEGSTFKDARSLVNSLVNRKDLSDDVTLDALSKIDFVAYEVVHPRLDKEDQMALLKQQGFKVVHFEKVDVVDPPFLSALFAKRRAESEYYVDGVVVEASGKHDISSARNPTYAAAFKMVLDDQGADTVVLEVAWETSQTGKLIPRVRYEPILVNGISLQWATGFNARYINDHSIGVGSKIRVIRSGDVIPKIDKVMSRADVVAKPDAPFEWDSNRVHYVLVHTANNSTMQIKGLVRFFTKMGIDNIKEGLVERFHSLGFKTVKDYLVATTDDFLKLPGVNSTLAQKMHDNIQSRISGVDVVTAMVASNVFGDGVGERKLKALMVAAPTILGPAKVSVDTICAIEGFQIATAQKIADGIPKFKSWLKHHPMIKVAYVVDKSSRPRVVFSGFRNKELEERAGKAGYDVGASVTQDTVLVVAKDPSVSTAKVQQARSLGVRVVSIREFEHILMA
jgi:NAD-dependent DNA ligase